MKKAEMNISKETTRIMDLPECWISDKGEFVHFKDFQRQRKLPTIEGKFVYLLDESNLALRVVKNSKGETVVEYWNHNSYEEEKLSLPLYELVNGKFNYKGTHTGLVQSHKMLNDAWKLYEIIQKRMPVSEKFEQQAQKEAVEKEKYEEVKARLLANKKLAGVGFVSNVIPNFSKFENTMRVFNLRHTVGKKVYPSFYYVVFDTERINNKSVIELEVPQGKITRYMGKQQANVKYWAAELGVKFIHVVEAK